MRMHVTVSGIVSNSSCNNVVSTVCRNEVIKITACEMSSNHYTTDVQGRLWGNLSFWENTLGLASWIISCIKEGYKLPLHSIPDHFRRPNQQSTLDHQDLLHKLYRS